MLWIFIVFKILSIYFAVGNNVIRRISVYNNARIYLKYKELGRQAYSSHPHTVVSEVTFRRSKEDGQWVGSGHWQEVGLSRIHYRRTLHRTATTLSPGPTHTLLYNEHSTFHYRYGYRFPALCVLSSNGRGAPGPKLLRGPTFILPQKNFQTFYRKWILRIQFLISAVFLVDSHHFVFFST